MSSIKNQLCVSCNDDGWYPTPIHVWEKHLSKFIKNSNIKNAYSIRKNISYNLQYLELQTKLLSEIKLTDVLIKQTNKMIIVVTSSIIEAFLFVLLVNKNLHKTTIWEKLGKTSNELTLNSKKHKIESIVYCKLSEPVLDEMTFQSTIKTIERKKLLGDNRDIYKSLNYLRKLRNKIHIHAINENSIKYDTDYNNFDQNAANKVMELLYKFMKAKLFFNNNEDLSDILERISFLKNDKLN